jgi:hypothetical protein
MQVQPMLMEPGRQIRRHAYAAIVAGLIAACSIFSPDGREHPIVGSYDVTMSFLSTSTRVPCTPPATGYCSAVDSIAFTRAGLLRLSDASAVEGPATFSAEVTLGAESYRTVVETGEIPAIDASGAFTVPYLRHTDGYESIYMQGALQSGVGISGTVRKGNSVYYQSTGTFTGLRLSR